MSRVEIVVPPVGWGDLLNQGGYPRLPILSGEYFLYVVLFAMMFVEIERKKSQKNKNVKTSLGNPPTLNVLSFPTWTNFQRARANTR